MSPWSVGEGDVAKLDFTSGTFQGAGAGVLLRGGVQQTEQALAGGDAALELVVHVGQAFQRLEQHHHGGDHDGEGARGQGRLDAVDGGDIEEDRKATGGHHLTMGLPMASAATIFMVCWRIRLLTW